MSETIGVLIAEGKTKIIMQVESEPREIVHVISKDDITAGDGKKHDILEGKAKLATSTTSCVFELLKAAGLPVAFYEQVDDITFSAPLCKMLPWEVVVRAEAHGSYLKRNPVALRGDKFDRPTVEFYLKTKNRKWRDFDLPCDDPYAQIGYSFVRLYKPDEKIIPGNNFLQLKNGEVYEQPCEASYFADMAVIAQHSFTVLERMFKEQGYVFCDCKFEFGIGPDGELLIADVLDNDSWRLTKGGEYLDKQVYRDGGSLEDVLAKYTLVKEITSKFPEFTLQATSWVRSTLQRPFA